MGHELQSLIDAPLANATKVNAPGGRRPRPRAEAGDDIGFPKVTQREAADIKRKKAAAGLGDLLDYYAKTELTAERIAEHLGLYIQERTGTDKEGKPTFARVPDVKRVENELARRRKAA